MPETATIPSPIVGPLAGQFGFSQWAIDFNLEGISDEEALILPQPGGNSDIRPSAVSDATRRVLTRAP